MNELPDVPGLHAEPDQRSSDRDERSVKKERTGSSRTAIIASVVLSVLFSGVVTLSGLLIGKQAILELFGVSAESKKPDPYLVAIDDVKGMVQILADDVDALKSKQSELQESINTASFTAERASQRLTTLERFSSDLEKKIAEQKKIQQVAAAKPIAKPVPKPAPVIPVVLVSIRNIAGTSYVSLRDGLDDSDLLMPGDSWRGWTLVAADPSSKTASFTVAGKPQELRL
ncbi:MULTISPECIES: hypothetical protein [unclassified Cellvibrio]|uniref:hypothetical protein n=1 Tax=unclassified Cellvibrio TaxID=2624793 RepID=UPI0012473A23|nr:MULTISPECIES: hypothetical protein [unclassified Cellvibrio]QEY16071.1 hypothetical protein D0C16_08790 [Cellvibrio sp. KY-GH-1]UUA74299.1 hypothetical protein NNX04_07610 [Cellvibrio sp. QJXJ]